MLFIVKENTMIELTNEQLTERENALRNQLVDKSGRFNSTPENLLHSLQIELQNITRQLKEVEAERVRRELELP